MSDSLAPPEGFKQLGRPIPAENLIGPFYYRRDGEALEMGFRVEEKNSNGNGACHGGVLSSFADYCATMVALQGVKESCVTISLHCDYLAPARVGDWVSGRAQVLRRSRSMTFLRGELAIEGNDVLAFQAVMRRIGQDPKAV